MGGHKPEISHQSTVLIAYENPTFHAVGAFVKRALFQPVAF